MWKDRPEVIELAREFAQLMEKHDIWYTVDCGSMLGAIRNEGMIPWDDDFDVMMTWESFQKLKKAFPDRVIDTDEKGYPLLIPKFMKNKNDFLKSAVFVDIFLVVRTNEKKIQEYTSFRNKTRFAMQCVHSKWHAFNFGSKFLKVISWPFKWIPKRMTYKEAYETLFDPKGNYAYTIDNPIDPIKINKHKLFSLARKRVKFEDFEVYVPIEYRRILINKYGKNYMSPNNQERSIEHVNAISIVKVKREKQK